MSLSFEKVDITAALAGRRSDVWLIAGYATQCY
jgi:hypothetical protein